MHRNEHMACQASCHYFLETGIFFLRMINVKWITETNLASVFSGNKKAMGHKCLEGLFSVQCPTVSLIPSRDCLARLFQRKQVHRMYTSLNKMITHLSAVEDNQPLTHIHMFTIVPVPVAKHTLLVHRLTQDNT